MQYIDRENVYLDNLEEHPEKRGHWKVPKFEGLWATKTGKFYSDYKGKYLFVHMTKGGYPTIRVQGQNRYVHILLADTFIKKPEDVQNPWVNHRDGVKHNFSLGNLEWTTPSNNLIHAFKNNLRSDNKSVLLKDILTDEIKEFNGLNECARYLDKSQARLSMYLNGENETPLYGKYDLVWKGNPWNNFTKEDLGRVRKGVPRAIVAINIVDSNISIYESATDASNAIGICRTEISTRANGKKPPIVKGYRFVWLHEWILENKQCETRPPGLKNPV